MLVRITKMSDKYNLRNSSQKQEHEAEWMYENPHVAEKHEDRLVNAVSYVRERKWTWNTAATKAGVSRNQLQR